MKVWRDVHKWCVVVAENVVPDVPVSGGDQGSDKQIIKHFTMQEKKDLKARVYEILQKHSIKQVDLAREIGIHHSTLSLWMQNKNKGKGPIIWVRP
jgi:DNA-binding transcriptional regulator YiaG